MPFLTDLETWIKQYFLSEILSFQQTELVTLYEPPKSTRTGTSVSTEVSK